MTFEASHKAKVYLSPDNTTFTQVDANESTITISREVIDVTTLGGSGWHDRIYGIKDWSVSLPNLWQSGGAVSALIRNSILNGTDLYIRIDVDGTSSNRFSGKVIYEGIEIGLNLSDAVSTSGTLQGNGELTATFAS